MEDSTVKKQKNPLTIVSNSGTLDKTHTNPLLPSGASFNIEGDSTLNYLSTDENYNHKFNMAIFDAYKRINENSRGDDGVAGVYWGTNSKDHYDLWGEVQQFLLTHGPVPALFVCWTHQVDAADWPFEGPEFYAHFGARKKMYDLCQQVLHAGPNPTFKVSYCLASTIVFHHGVAHPINSFESGGIGTYTQASLALNVLKETAEVKWHKHIGEEKINVLVNHYR